ncbi:DNA repair protein RAD51 homolog 3-like [Rhipicephalus microplus]|uniref:DNA repair protein RAD51 homolog 3-like n=1 Tax=Rhipicephalus microplus TaxID=6941 RepID=UPI003F6A6923
MSKRDFCSLILPQRVRRRLQEAGIEHDDDLMAAGPSFAAEATLVLERRRETPVFTFNTALECLKRSEKTQRIATWIPSIDAMLDGGIPRHKIIEVTGAAGTGKTQFCMQVAASNELSKKSTVYVDSKGGFTIARYREIFAGTSRRQERSGVTRGDGGAGLRYTLCDSWQQLVAAVSLLPDRLRNCEAKEEITLVVLDGFDFHLRNQLHDPRERKKVLSGLTQKLVEIANCGAAVLVTNHLSMKPSHSDPSSLVIAPALGQGFGHECAYRTTFAGEDGLYKATFYKAPTFGRTVVSFRIQREGIVEETDGF